MAPVTNVSAIRLVITITALLAVLIVAPASAHRSGRHRWHSCPSDHGTHLCGDLGHCSECPDNQYCEAGRARAVGDTPTKDPGGTQLGLPPKDAWTCPVTHPIKGNFTTYSGERCIYHVPGGQFYTRTKPERCYATEKDANQDGCRRSKR